MLVIWMLNDIKGLVSGNAHLTQGYNRTELCTGQENALFGLGLQCQDSILRGKHAKELKKKEKSTDTHLWHKRNKSLHLQLKKNCRSVWNDYYR